MKDFEKMPDTKFGSWLFSNMKARNYSCTMVAQKLHTTRQAVRNHVVGINKPSYVWIMAYCQIFNCNPDKVWEMITKEES